MAPTVIYVKQVACHPTALALLYSLLSSSLDDLSNCLLFSVKAGA